MTSDDLPDPGNRGPVRDLVRLFLTQLLAVLGIAAVIVLVVALIGPDDDDEIRAGVPDSTPTASPQNPSPSQEESTAPAPTTSTTPEGATTTTTAPTATTPTVRRVKVDVLNQSAPNGAASLVAADLRDDGLRIGRVDDFNGNVSTNTVYWLERKNRQQAREVSRLLGGFRVQRGFDTLVDGRVTVILVDGVR